MDDSVHRTNKYEQSLLHIRALQEELHIDKLKMDKLRHELDLCRANGTIRVAQQSMLALSLCNIVLEPRGTIGVFCDFSKP
ncbi:hypothetical protein EVAR_86037_1 [Eumeta japonica]|uniref:Uncharacterized protein n=1 Tax=Eumeta variegata TaxID=151549 RepID=A0A4C1UJE1_EUMVA|nr:hypothetical protein EVAR_86037_1 [Eumeta japonica]